MTTVHTSVRDGVGRLVLAHPPLNILTGNMLADMQDALEPLARDPSLRALVITAEGKHFSAGADVREHLPPEYQELIPKFLETVRAIAGFPLPVVAAVQGRCLGGGFELIQAADIVVAGESAMFGQPEIMLGVFPPAACVLLPDWCPPGVVAEIVMTGDPISAREAERVGLVRRVVADDQVEEEALVLAGRIARHSGAALRMAKHALRKGKAVGREAALEEAGKIYVNELMQTADALEGLRAFQEKREPAWSHA